MKLSDFMMLSEMQKKAAVLHLGVLIGKRESCDYKVFLFQMDNYYVETFCSVQSKSIEEFRIFDNTKLLRPYLEAIAIDDLLN